MNERENDMFKKVKVKKAACMILSAMLTFSMMGCGNSDDNDKDSMKETKEDLKNYIFEEDPDFSIDGIKGDVSSMAFSEDTMFVTTVEYDDSGMDSEETYDLSTYTDAASETDAGYSATCRFYKVPKDGGTAEAIFESDDKLFEKVIVGSDGSAYVTVYNGEDQESVSLYSYKDGDFKEFKDISDIVHMSDDHYFNKFMIDKDGDFIAVYDTMMVIYDSDFNKKNEFSTSENDYLDCAQTDKNGDVVISISKYDEETENLNTSIKKYNKETNKLEGDYKMDGAYASSGGDLMTGNGDYDFYYVMSSCVYGFKYSDGSSTKILAMTDSDIESGYMSLSIMVSPTEFYYADMSGYYMEDSSGEGCTVKKYVKVDPSKVADKKVLTLASLFGEYSSLKKAVSEFNKSQNEYRITIVDYSSEQDPSEKLSADILSGNYPDLYDLSMGLGNLSKDQCISKGLFEDLTPFVEKDEEISPDDFIPSVYETMCHDGKLYSVASAFTLNTLYAKGSEVGGNGGWTVSEMKEYVDSKKEDGVRLFYNDSKEANLANFLNACGREFVNWDKGECYFDSDDFKSILEMSNISQNNETTWSEEDPSRKTLIDSGELLFVEGSVDADEIVMVKNSLGKDMAYKGYPTKDKRGSFFYFADSVAMSSKCEDKEGAWKFIRTLMTEDYQGKNYQKVYAIPTREDVFEAYVESITCTKKGTDKYGNEITPRTGEMGYAEDSFEMKPLTDEDVKFQREIIDSGYGEWGFDEKLMEIVNEEATAYFNGDKSVDDVCKVIQNRATTYVNENK